MKWGELLLMVAGETVFSTSMLLAGEASPTGIRRQLDRWVKAGKLNMLRRGVYCVEAPYARGAMHPFIVANRLRKSSYVSLQSALAYYGMIPEHTPVTTSVTTSRPEQLDTSAGRFAFRHLKTTLFFGYVEHEVAPGQKAVIATPEKALLDLLYLTPGSDAVSYLEELRVERLPAFDSGRLADLAVRMKSAKVLRAVKRIGALWARQKEETTL